MPTPARTALALLSAAAIATIGVLLVRGAADGPTAAGPCGPATDATYLATALGVAERIRREEQAGATVSRARTTIQSDRVLARAVARGDAAQTRREALVVLFDGEHIVRLRVFDSAGRVLADVGGKFVLSPVYAVLRAGGRRVGRVEYSVQDDMGYRLLTDRLDGVLTVMRYAGRTVMADIDVGARRLPTRGTVRVHGVAYLVATIVTSRFPTGRLRISALVRRPPRTLARQSCAQVRADVLGAVTRRVYGEDSHGPEVLVGRVAIRRSHRLAAALAAGRRGPAWVAAADAMAAGHLVRLAVRAHGRVLADVGDTQPLIAPTAVAVRDGAHRIVGHALFAVQSARGFVGVSSYLTDSDVLVREGSRQLAGRFGGPSSVPRSGPVRYDGDTYDVASFRATKWPSGPITVYTLARDG